MEILCLFGMHFLYDFSLQGEFIAKYKSKSWFILLIHSFTWAWLLCMVLWYFGHFEWGWLILFTITHAAIDKTKAVLLTGQEKHDKWLLYGDQLAHAITIAIVLYANEYLVKWSS